MDKLHYKIAIIKIEGTCFHENASQQAIFDVLKTWLQLTKRSQRTWQTLCNTTKKCEDKSLEQYILAYNLKGKFNFMTGVMKQTSYTGTIYNQV